MTTPFRPAEIIRIIAWWAAGMAMLILMFPALDLALKHGWSRPWFILVAVLTTALTIGFFVTAGVLAIRERWRRRDEWPLVMPPRE